MIMTSLVLGCRDYCRVCKELVAQSWRSRTSSHVSFLAVTDVVKFNVVRAKMICLWLRRLIMIMFCAHTIGVGSVGGWGTSLATEVRS